MIVLFGISIIVCITNSEIQLAAEHHTQNEIEILEVEIVRVTNELQQNCPDSPILKTEQSEYNSYLTLQQKYKKIRKSYQHLFDELVRCRASKLTTFAINPLTSTVSPLTNNLLPEIRETCESALNLTDGWRLDHKGSQIHGNGSERACDSSYFNGARTRWFRFTEAAGNRLLSKCPKYLSCGSKVGLWSDKQPVDDGEVGVVNSFPVYGSGLGVGSGTCTYFGPYESSSINCGNSDVIYRHDASTPCFTTYCGMF